MGLFRDAQLKILASDCDGTLFNTSKEGPIDPHGGRIVAGDSTTEMFLRMSKDLPTAYVTGRNIRELHEGIKEYGLESLVAPFAGVDTGLHMYRREGGELKFDAGFNNRIIEYVKFFDWNKEEYRRILSGSSEASVFVTKDAETQDPASLKVQWTVVNVGQLDEFTTQIQRAVERISPSAAVVISSFDAAKNRGFIDLMPLFNFDPGDPTSEPVTGKVIAAEYIRRNMDVGKEHVVFAGDSGNDTLALVSGYKGVLIENASQKVVDRVDSLARKRGNREHILMPRGDWGCFKDGRCLRGVIRGVAEHAGVSAEVLFDQYAQSR